MESVRKILKKYYTQGRRHTHVSLIQPRGKFDFDRRGLGDLWSRYSDAIGEKDAIFGLAEKSQNYLPVLVDVDIKIKAEEDEEKEFGERLYTEEQVKEVIQVYHSVLRKIVDECTDKKLTCVLLEKDMYTITKGDVTYLKNGFHLHFPYLFLSRADHEIHLVPRVKEELNNLGTFSEFAENSGDMVDEGYCKAPWLLYGSRKNEASQPYLVSKVFNADLEEVDLEQTFKYYEIYDQKEKLIEVKGKVKYYLPQILSIVPHSRSVSYTRNSLISPLKEKLKQKKKDKGEYKQKDIKEQLEIATRLIPMLSDERAQEYNSWMTVGWVLYNISDGNEEGLDLWCDFSARCEEQYNETECHAQWRRMVKRDFTLGTLCHFAKVDNPREYAKYKRERSQKFIQEAITKSGGSHYDMAKVLHARFGDEFVCGSITNKTWFQYNQPIWERIEDGVFLRQKISEDVVQEIWKEWHHVMSQLAMAEGKDNGEDKETLATRSKRILKIIGNLKSFPYKINIMKSAMDIFYDKRFKDKLDTNPYLIAFKNGVYDLKQNVFRKGLPEDFLSKCMPIDYVNYSEDDEKVQEIHNFLEKIFPDKSLRRYFLDISSDVFVGGNHQKIVLFWTGEGDNGKSVTQNFFEQMLGKYAIKFNTSVITGKKVGMGAANAELARAGGGVRWAVLEEPDGDEEINVGTLKHLSGNDTFYARDLFERGKDGREIVPMFKLTLIANDPPKLKHADTATWNRVRVLPFESTFCRPDNPAPETWEEQLRQKRFPMDKNFGAKIPGLLSAFAWVLLEHRKKPRNYNEPEKVLIATARYKKKNDIYRQFMEEYIMEDEKNELSLTELYSQFKEWHRESMPNQKIPVRSELEGYFTKLWGDPEPGKKWFGYKIRSLQDKIDSGDIVILGDDDLVDYNAEDEDEDDQENKENKKKKNNLPPL